MRVLICGARDWTNKEAILEQIPLETTVIIEGDATGADKMAGELADELGIEKEVYPAPWEEYKAKYPYPMWLKAGTDRNKQMLVEGKPDLVLAFHNDIDNSRGTKDMTNRSRKALVETRLYSEDGLVWDYKPPERMF